MSDFRPPGGRARPPGIVEALHRLEELRSTPWGPFDEPDGAVASARKTLFDALQREIVDPLVRDAGATPAEHALKLAFAGLVGLFHHQHMEINDQLARGKFDQPGCKMLLKIVDRMLRLDAAFSEKSWGERRARGRGARKQP